MDATQALRDSENALRDFIAITLERSLGPEWVGKCGVTSERIAKWSERKADEHKRQEAGVVDERLLYYADFYDLKTILKKHWQGDFSEALGDWRRFEVFFDELARYRDPDAHRRELLPHQQSLVLGIAGEIRSRLVRWRSRRETPSDCFPRIESARDSLGNLWLPSLGTGFHHLDTGTTLRPGDTVDFVITARDPDDLPLEFSLEVLERTSEGVSESLTGWQPTSVFPLRISVTHIASRFLVQLRIRSSRSYHANLGYDDQVIFIYTVLPSFSNLSA